MPTPKKNEKKKDFIDRCVPIVLADGTTKDNDQAVAICNSLWEQDKKDNIVMEKEIRTLATPASVEKRDDGKLGKIYGYASVFNSDSEDMGFIEQIAPGAFKKALKKSDVRGLKNHNPDLIFARKGLNLKLKEDDTGLYYEATPIDTHNYREVAGEVAAGLLTGQSFGFTVGADEWRDLDKPIPRRVITEVKELFDVGPVTYPAYQDTTVALRSLEKAKGINPENFHVEGIENDEENEVITVRDGEAIFTFESIEQFNRIAEKVESLRSVSSPTTPDADNTDDVPMNTKSSDDKNLITERIDNILKKYGDGK